jgi:hypothetical protein
MHSPHSRKIVSYLRARHQPPVAVTPPVPDHAVNRLRVAGELSDEAAALRVDDLDPTTVVRRGNAVKVLAPGKQQMITLMTSLMTCCLTDACKASSCSFPPEVSYWDHYPPPHLFLVPQVLMVQLNSRTTLAE